MPKNKHKNQRLNILITGCSSGIGFEAAQILQQRGHQVIATVRTVEDTTRLTKAGIRSLLCDLNDSTAIHTLVETTLQLFNGHIDVLFNNAAYGQPGAVEDLTRQALRAQFETNVFGTQELTNLLIRQMRKQNSGRIIYNSSILGLIALPYRGAYNASKYAIEGLADTLRLELRDTNIHISLIEPGPIISRFRQNAFAKYQQHIDKHNSAHRERYIAMEKRLTAATSVAPFTLPAKAVVDKLLHAIEAKRPKARYYVTFPTHLFAFLKRVLNTSTLDWVLSKVSQNEQR